MASSSSNLVFNFGHSCIVSPVDFWLSCIADIQALSVLMQSVEYDEIQQEF